MNLYVAITVSCCCGGRILIICELFAVFLLFRALLSAYFQFLRDVAVIQYDCELDASLKQGLNQVSFVVLYLRGWPTDNCFLISVSLPAALCNFEFNQKFAYQLMVVSESFSEETTLRSDHIR